MPRITVEENDRISVWCEPESFLIGHEMHKPTYGEALHEALLKGVEAMRTYGAFKWLSDDRKNGALPPEHARWADTVWSPLAIAAGWRYWGLVQPEMVVGQMSMSRLVPLYADKGVTVRTFTSPSDARHWLDQLS